MANLSASLQHAILISTVQSVVVHLRNTQQIWLQNVSSFLSTGPYAVAYGPQLL